MPMFLPHPLALLISAACGIILALPFRDLRSSLPAWLALAPIFWIVSRAESRRWALAAAAVFALCWSAASFTFLWHLAAPGVVALSIYTSLFYVGALMGIRRLARYGIMNAVIGGASLWALVEILRSIVPVLAFPWLLLGHTLYENDLLRQSADLLGVYGLSFLMAAVNGLLAFALPAWLPERCRAVPGSTVKAAWKAFSLVGALLLGAFAYGHARVTQISPRLKPGAPVGVIQGNIIQKLDRTEDEMTRQLMRHLELHREVVEESKQTGNGPPVLVCWAETMVPGFLNYDTWGATFKREVAAIGIPTLAGSNFLIPEDTALQKEAIAYNAAYFLNEKGEEVFHYFKRRLVPFGEYIPFVQRYPFLKVLRSVTRDAYMPGSDPSPVHAIGGYKIALNICVEDIHPDLAREAAAAGADTLLNITNDGWFYKDYGPRAHMMAAVWRAIEVRRPLLRITNTGHTVAVDPLGRIDEPIPLETEGTATVALKQLQPKSASANPATGPRTLTMALGESGTALIFACMLLLAAGLKQKQ